MRADDVVLNGKNMIGKLDDARLFSSWKALVHFQPARYFLENGCQYAKLRSKDSIMD
jgi:hypothetical protein